MALGCIAAFANEPDCSIIIVNQEDKFEAPSIKAVEIQLMGAKQSDVFFEYKECEVEGDEWNSETIIYADAPLPGYCNPVIPVSHAPPKA